MRNINFNLKNKNDSQMKNEILSKMKQVKKIIKDDMKYESLFYDVVHQAQQSKEDIKLDFTQSGGNFFCNVFGVFCPKKKEITENDVEENNENNMKEKEEDNENNMKEKEEENGINIPNLMDNQVQDIEDNDNDNGNPPPIEFGGKKSVSLSNLFLGGNKEDFSDVESQISLSDDDLSYNPHTTLFYEEAEDSLMDHIKNMTSKKYLKNLKVDELKEILRKNNQKITEKGNYLSKQNLIKRVIKMYK
jgi:hypothetical protein